MLNKYRIKYKIGKGYHVQWRDWESYWIYQDVGYYDDYNNFRIKYHPNLDDAEKVVKRLAWEKTAERTVCLFRGN